MWSLPGNARFWKSLLRSAARRRRRLKWTSAGHDASVIDTDALDITDASSVDDVKKALAASQALARVKLHQAKVARAHCDVMEAALAAAP
jgi:hypothetical protein